MLELLKRLTGPKPTPEYRDSLLGVLVNRTEGEWRGEIPFRNYHVTILLPGAEYQPSSTRLAFARSLVPGIAAKVETAFNHAAQANPDLWRGKLRLCAVNLLYQATTDAFALDFMATGDRSGKRWQVRFEGGQPVQLEHC